MKQNETMLNQWMNIWSDVDTIDEIVTLAARQRALPEDIEEARHCLERFNEAAQEFLDSISEYVRSQCEPHDSSCGN